MLTREIICLDCFRNLIMSWMFKAPAVIMKVIISWLFKDPIITVTWLNFNRAQSNSKKKMSYQDVPFSGTKRPICLEQNFSIQTSIITFIYLLALFIVQNLQKILTVDPKLWGCPIFGPKMVHLPQTFFFEKLLISFSSNY